MNSKFLFSKIKHINAMFLCLSFIVLLIIICFRQLMGSLPAKSINFTVTREQWCQKFGQVQCIKDPTNPSFQGIRIVLDADQIKQASKSWEKIIQLLSSEEEIKDLIELPISYGWKSQSSFCDCDKEGRATTYEVIYNRFFTTLSSELKLRTQKGIQFSQAEIWFLGYTLLKVSFFFEARSWHLGNIHPKNIMIDKEGMIKVFTTLSSPAELQNCELVKQSKYNDAYLAPQQSIKNQKEQQIFTNKSKIDSYYIGLVMLSLACLKDLYFIFNHSQSSIKFDALGLLLLKLKRSRDKYSQHLYFFIENMLNNDPQQRNTPQCYFQILKKYEKEIIQMNGIDFQHASIEDFKFSNKKNVERRKYHAKQIIFLTLSKKYKEQTLSTKQKPSKFIDEESNPNQKTNLKLF